MGLLGADDGQGGFDSRNVHHLDNTNSCVIIHPMNTTLYAIRPTIYIETVHGVTLESVLEMGSDRTGVDYYEELTRIITEAFKGTNYQFIEYGAYGRVWVTVEVEKIEEIAHALAIVDKAVAKWLAKYNINRMKKFKD